MGKYERVQYVVGKDSSVLQCGRVADKTVNVRPNLPGNVIVIHGVNDVGTAYEAVEKGLCEGLKARIGWQYVPGKYRMPTAEDKGVLQADPDAVFFKRQISDETHSPIIPFYWGFREETKRAGSLRGQRIDRYGNRLDKDLSKEGGPFANATSTLPDMWGRGKSKAWGLLDWAQKDATHPVLDNPGHLYMVLAAKRLAALIAMIRDYDDNEAVSLVAHSQGCMLSLLAQAFLMDDGLRPADTLILNNPPYSLVDVIPTTTNMVEWSSGEDVKMRPEYESLKGRQTLHARLQTLVNIVHGVVSKKHSSPAFATLNDHCQHHGMVSGLWKASSDRDNRGKVYLYFCPEDMTVSLNNVQGIGWQGIPDTQHGKKAKEEPVTLRDPDTRQYFQTGQMRVVPVDVVRHPMAELTALNKNGAGFFQRVFTNKNRPDPKTGTPVMIGQAAPHDYVLRVKGEDDQAHTETSDSLTSNFFVRARLKKPAYSIFGSVSPEEARMNVRTINGDPLPVPVRASLNEGARVDARGRAGALEDVDPIDAAIAITSDYGLEPGGVCRIIPDPTGQGTHEGARIERFRPEIYEGFLARAPGKIEAVQAFLNKDKPAGQQCKVIAVLDCLGISAPPNFTGQILVHRSETPDEARLRWQHANGARSFHGAIFGGAENHRQVTAYDIAIGGGKAASDPMFYAYLCAVADWRMQTDMQAPRRPSIPLWKNFVKKFDVYWKAEPSWRRELINGTADYYSTGILPSCVPTLLEGLPTTVVCETLESASYQRLARKLAPVENVPAKAKAGGT
jgi:pimeloyl-ACP methyl ester carboxylesterase